MLIKENMDKYQLEGISYIGIDRVVIGIPFNQLDQMDGSIFPGEKLKEANTQIHYIQDTLTEIFGISGKPLKGIPLLKRYHLKSEEGSGNLIGSIMVGRNPNGLPVLNFEFNPSKISQGDWQEYEVALSLLLFNHYEELYLHGVVSHFEFFLDLEQYLPDDLVLISLARRSHSQYKNTQYRGRRGSKLVGTIYDKSGQLKQSCTRTRIEVRLNRRDMLFRDLVGSNIPNPLKNFLVVSSDALKTISTEWKMPDLGNKIKNFGLFEGVSNRYARAAIKQRLQELVVSFWKPDELWETYKTMLSEFRPDFIGGFDKQLAPLH